MAEWIIFVCHYPQFYLFMCVNVYILNMFNIINYSCATSSTE